MSDVPTAVPARLKIEIVDTRDDLTPKKVKLTGSPTDRQRQWMLQRLGRHRDSILQSTSAFGWRKGM